MGDRIKVKELIEWLTRFNPESDVAFFIKGKGKEIPSGVGIGVGGDAYDLFEIWERPIGGPKPSDTVLFLNLK